MAELSVYISCRVILHVRVVCLKMCGQGIALSGAGAGNKGVTCAKKGARERGVLSMHTSLHAFPRKLPPRPANPTSNTPAPPPCPVEGSVRTHTHRLDLGVCVHCTTGGCVHGHTSLYAHSRRGMRVGADLGRA